MPATMADRSVSYRPGPGPRGRVADRPTEGSAIGRLRSDDQPADGFSRRRRFLAKSVWQAGYALESRGAENLRAG